MYKKFVENGYIVGIISGVVGGNISEDEFNQISELFDSTPEAEKGFCYRLREDLTWELYELPPAPIDDEISAEEALNIITGGAT